MEFRGFASKYRDSYIEIPYECIKEITRTLRKTYKNMDCYSYGYCCGSDYDYYHKKTDNKDYISAVIYKGGMNNDYHNGKFEIGEKVYFFWDLPTYQLNDVIATMNSVASKYECIVTRPKDRSKCIAMTYMPTRANLYELYYERQRFKTDSVEELSFNYFNKYVYTDDVRRNELLKEMGIEEESEDRNDN